MFPSCIAVSVGGNLEGMAPFMGSKATISMEASLWPPKLSMGLLFDLSQLHAAIEKWDEKLAELFPWNADLVKASPAAS